MRQPVILGGGVIAVVAALAFGGWWFLIRDTAPVAVNLDDAIAAAQGTASASGDTSSGRSDLTGRWTLADGGTSFAGYRIDEELASIGGNTAVGRSTAIEGSLEFDGSAITAVEVVVDMTQLESDDSRRDGQLERRAIQTNQFPTATFVLTESIAVAAVPEGGASISATASGELTLHGVTRPVEVALEGQMTDGRVVVVGSVDVALADYDIEPPTSLSVLSVADVGVMEFQLVFE